MSAVPNAGSINNDLTLQLGIYMAGAGEPVRNPSLPTAGDSIADWLYLGRFYIGYTGAPPTQFGQANPGFPSTGIDVRAMRKVTADEVVTLVFALGRAGAGALNAADSVTVVTQSDALFSRTPR